MNKMNGNVRMGRADEREKEKKKNLLITPRILEAIRSTSLELEGFLERMRTAVLSRTTEMALRPAARIVSPDSTGFTMLPICLFPSFSFFCIW